MSSLSEYIEKIKKYKEEHPDISEIELIRYVYMDLGERSSYDTNFIPFGNNKKCKAIYEKEDGNNIGKNCIIVVSKGKSDVYMYDEKEYKYHQVEMKDFAKLVKDGLIIHHNSKVPGLGRALKELKQEEKTR